MRQNLYKSFLFPLTLSGTFVSVCHAVPELAEIREDHFPHGTLLRVPIGFSQGNPHHLEVDSNASVEDIRSEISKKRQSLGLSQIIPLSEKDNLLALFPWAKASLEHEKSPMTGQIIHMFVKKGDRVKRGDPLFIVTAMKMESTIRASTSGRIHKIFVEENDKVEASSDILCSLPLTNDWDNLDPSFIRQHLCFFEALFPWASEIKPQTHSTYSQNVEPKTANIEPTPRPSENLLQDANPHPPVEMIPQKISSYVTPLPACTEGSLPYLYKAPVIQNQRYLFKTPEVYERTEIYFHNSPRAFSYSTNMIPTQLPSVSSPLRMECDLNPSTTKTRSFSKGFMAEDRESQGGFLNLCLAALAALLLFICKNRKKQSPQPTSNVIRVNFSSNRSKTTRSVHYRKAA